MRRTMLALALLCAPPAFAAEGVVACGEFKSAWAGALAKLDLGRPPGYGAPNQAGTEAFQGLAGLEGSATCRDGILGRFELRGTDEGRFARAAASVLLGLDRDMSQENAASMVAALRTEAKAKPATSSWGPYDLTLTAPKPGAAEELILDLPEN